jgi:hypothetical protein
LKRSVFVNQSKSTNRQRDIAHISNRGNVVLKTALPKLPYYQPVEDNGIIYSIDMIRLKFKIKSPQDTEKVMNVIRDTSIYGNPTPYEYDYIERRKWYQYHHNFNITLPNGNSFYLAISLNCDDRTKQCQGVLEYNPNKCDSEVLKDILQLIIGHSKYIKLERYDLAVDVPYSKSQVKIIKDNRKYSLLAPSKDPDTYSEYLGKHQSSGFVKVYNKKIESNLEDELTRIEITSENTEYDKFIKQFPEVYIKGTGSENLFPYIELTKTDLVLYELLEQNPDCEMYFKRLGKDKQKKLKPYLYENSNKKITVPEKVFVSIMIRLNGFITGVYCNE